MKQVSRELYFTAKTIVPSDNMEKRESVFDAEGNEAMRCSVEGGQCSYFLHEDVLDMAEVKHQENLAVAAELESLSILAR